MAVDNVSFSITNKCNSRCNICNIWKEKCFSDELSVLGIEKLFSNPGFSDVNTVSITGGEPFLRNDVNEIIITLKKVLKNLNRVFLNTNATIVDNVVKTSELCSTLFKETIVSISVDGPKNIHDSLRGISCHNNALVLIDKLHLMPNVKTSVSMTLSKNNADYSVLDYVYQLAESYGAMFSFRLADTSPTYYKNTEMRLGVSDEQKSVISQFIGDKCMDNPFLRALKEFIDTGNVKLIYENGRNKCLAGKKFMFVHPNGDIAPCLYSTNKLSIDQINNGNVPKLGKYEPCPCCTDCAIYPILEHTQKIR